MKSSFLPKYEIFKISALTTQGRNPDNSEINWPLALVKDLIYNLRLFVLKLAQFSLVHTKGHVV